MQRGKGLAIVMTNVNMWKIPNWISCECFAKTNGSMIQEAYMVAAIGDFCESFAMGHVTWQP